MNKNMVPGRSYRQLPSMFQHFFDDEFPSLFTDEVYSLSRAMRADIHETEDSYIVEIEAPGLKKEQIDIRLENNILTITAKHEQQGEDNRKNYIRRERRLGQISRSFHVQDVQEDAISAHYDNGMLCVALPKIKKSHLEGGRRIELN